MLESKTFAVLVENLYEDQELWYPVRRLQEAGATVLLVGPQQDKVYKSKHGYPARSDRAADDVDVTDLDGVIIPGGYAPDRMRQHASMVKLVKDAMERELIVAAICHAGWMLCSADVLEGRRATSYRAIKDDMMHAGAEWLDEEVIIDGNLITSRSPDDLPAFMRAIVEHASQPAAS
jgi:protease I